MSEREREGDGGLILDCASARCVWPQYRGRKREEVLMSLEERAEGAG